jgi:hypothetical protein
MVSRWSGNVNTTKRKTEGLWDADKEVGLDVSTNTAKCIFMFGHKHTAQNHKIKIVADLLKMWQSSTILN